MALANRKFVCPPKFSGAYEEDALEWLERYETTGTYNGWQPNDLAANMGMYLDGAARKWYLCTKPTLPTDWTDTPAVAGNANAVPPIVAANAIAGLKTRFLQEFRHENHSLFQEAKLRNRVQGIDETTSNYYYDVLDMCRSVDPHMREEIRLQHLFRGLKPSLFEKIYPLRPKTCAEFLASVKIHTEAALMANRKGWTATALSQDIQQKQTLTVANLRDETTGVRGNTDMIIKGIKELQEQLREMLLEGEETD